MNITMSKKKVSPEMEGVINKIIEMYPTLKREKNVIIENIFGKRKNNNVDNVDTYERFEHNNNYYYKEKKWKVLNKNAELVGIHSKNKDGEKIYVIFNDEDKYENVSINNNNYFGMDGVLYDNNKNVAGVYNKKDPNNYYIFKKQ